MTTNPPAREAAERATPEGLMELADEYAQQAWRNGCNGSAAGMLKGPESEARDKLAAALAGQQQQPVAWRPIAEFDFAKDAECRMRWMLATENSVIGECYYGQGPVYAGEWLNDEPHVKAWRYMHGDRRVPTHLVPTHFQPIPDAPDASTPPALPLPEPVAILRKALDDALIDTNERAAVIGHFCNHWNAALAATPSPTGQAPSDPLSDEQTAVKFYQDNPSAALFDMRKRLDGPAVPAEVSEELRRMALSMPELVLYNESTDQLYVQVSATGGDLWMDTSDLSDADRKVARFMVDAANFVSKLVSTPSVQPATEAVSAALEAVRLERLRQDEKWGGAEHDDHHTVHEWAQLIQDYAGWARTMAGMNSPDKARRRLIQIAAMAVAAAESMDRAALSQKGAQP
jgi:hypothetical protein